MRHPLYVAFVWHMHQPSYLDEGTMEMVLPWVRLHATKDYLHMVEVLEDYPDVHATFNIVPSMVEQLQAYVDGSITDRAWKVSLRADLTVEDKKYIDSLFFSVNRDRFIRMYPRYEQLYRIREQTAGDLDLLGDTYWRDLVAWFNLAWIDPGWLQRDPVLRSLAEKGSHFTIADVATILGKHREAMSVTLAAYRRLQRRGQVELSVTPYYHPILPLLIDSDCATEPSPWLRLPPVRYQRREDALEQLRRGIAYHEETFGRPPTGLWPSEGAVSQQLVELMAEVPEIRWMATDEAILARSFGRNVDRNGWGYLTDPRFLYKPYWARSEKHRVAMVFRDHYISDRIGFAYQGMTGVQAADDLVFRLACIHEVVKNDPQPSLVPIILDGENCWEHYERNGDTFLRALYGRLSSEGWVRAVTVDEFIREFPPRDEIPRLATGSWINGNLETWIGENTQNRAWEYLHGARQALAEAERLGRHTDEQLRQARQEMLAAEGSDWFWWYYSHNVSDQDELFDSMFRDHLRAVYRALELPAPSWVHTPIVASAPKLTSRAPRGYTRLDMDARDLSPAGWDMAGYLEPAGSSGTMQQGSALAKRLYFGYDEERVYLRLESHSSLEGYTVQVDLTDRGQSSENVAWESRHAEARVDANTGRPSHELLIRPGEKTVSISRWQDGVVWMGSPAGVKLVSDGNVFQVAVPMDAMGAYIGASIGVSVVLFRDNLVVQRLPEDGEIILELRQASDVGSIPARSAR